MSFIILALLANFVEQRNTNLARSANLLTGLYNLLALISFLMIARSPNISESTGPIFAIFAPNDRYLFIDDRSGSLFPIHQGTLPWQPIFGKFGKMTFIQQVDVPKRVGIWQFRFKNV